MDGPVGARPFPDLGPEMPLKLYLSDGFDPPRRRDKDEIREMLLFMLLCYYLYLVQLNIWDLFCKVLNLYVISLLIASLLGSGERLSAVLEIITFLQVRVLINPGLMRTCMSFAVWLLWEIMSLVDASDFRDLEQFSKGFHHFPLPKAYFMQHIWVGIASSVERKAVMRWPRGGEGRGGVCGLARESLGKIIQTQSVSPASMKYSMGW